MICLYILYRLRLYSILSTSPYLKNLSVQGVVKIQVGEVAGLHLGSSQQVCMKVPVQAQRLMNLEDETDVRQRSFPAYSRGKINLTKGFTIYCLLT